MANRVITISREFGSGGRTIGRKAAERLGARRHRNKGLETKTSAGLLTIVFTQI